MSKYTFKREVYFMEHYDIKEAGPTPLINAMCNTIEVTEIVDANTFWDEKQCKLSPGTLLKALLVNILCGRTPLCHVEKFFSEQDTEFLFGPGIACADLNDDALGRMLDKVYTAGPKKIFSALALSAITTDNVDLSTLHGDTTSRFTYGSFEGEGTLNITYGYSKDHRFDLKQYICGLATNKEGVPVLGDIRDGNLDDKTWNKEFMPQIKAALTPEQLKGLIYVADSAAVNEGCMKKARETGIRIISRLPNTFSLSAQLTEQAWKLDEWTELEPGNDPNKAVYKLWETTAELYDDIYRFVVVHSSHLDKRKLRGLENRLHKERDALSKDVAKLAKREFACEADALKELNHFIATHKSEFYPLSGIIGQETVRKKRNKKGRPAAGEALEYEDIFTIMVEVGALNQEAFQQEQQRLSCFVLVSSVDDSYTGADLLREYKEQSVVENRFKFIKSPTFVGPMYLQSRNRLEALCYVILAALLIYSLLERRVRRALQHEKEPLIMAGNVPSFRPTGRRVLELLAPIKILVLTEGGRKRRILPERYSDLDRVLRLAGFGIEVYI
jgi:transposase